MSEKKEKKAAEKPLSQADADAMAGIAALAAAICALDEPAEIADVPQEEHHRGKKEPAAEKDPRSREEKLMALMEKGKKAGKLTL